MRDHIDHWLIVDTGSTDGTQELIRTMLAGIPGEVVERPWVTFDRAAGLRGRHPTGANPV
nr:hypothetical protein [Sporichthya sp.]